MANFNGKWQIGMISILKRELLKRPLGKSVLSCRGAGGAIAPTKFETCLPAPTKPEGMWVPKIAYYQQNVVALDHNVGEINKKIAARYELRNWLLR